MQDTTYAPSAPKQRLVGILLFDDVEVLDFAGPFETFSIAQNKSGTPPFKVITVSQEGTPITAVGGLTVLPSYSFATCPRLDVLIVPGGKGARSQQLYNPALLQWVTHQSAQAEYVASVCTGAFILAQVGLLNGKTATTHTAHVNQLALIYPNITVFKNRRFVEVGNIITSAGVSAGIDMSLHLIKKMCGEAVSLQAAQNMEYVSSF